MADVFHFLLRVAVCFGSVLCLALAECPDGFVHHGDSCYKLFQLKATWAQAVVFCEVFDADLSEIESQSEQNFIAGYLSAFGAAVRTQDVWVGGSDGVLESRWTWLSSAGALEYSHWAPGEPNNFNSGENCLALFPAKGFSWNDASCELPMNFLCEIPVAGGHPIIPEIIG